MPDAHRYSTLPHPSMEKFIRDPSILYAHVFIMSSSISVNMIFIVRNKVIIKAVPARDGRKRRPFLRVGTAPGNSAGHARTAPANITLCFKTFTRYFYEV